MRHCLHIILVSIFWFSIPAFSEGSHQDEERRAEVRVSADEILRFGQSIRNDLSPSEIDGLISQLNVTDPMFLFKKNILFLRKLFSKTDSNLQSILLLAQNKLIDDAVAGTHSNELKNLEDVFAYLETKQVLKAVATPGNFKRSYALNLDGQMGSPVADGSDGQSGFGVGADGSSGHDGSNGNDGDNAGSAELKLAFVPGGYHLTAKGQLPSGQALQESVDLKNQSSIHATARGGNGSKGGDGGRGGDGTTGYAGAPGSKTSDGGDGGPGGDGGDAGDGGHGGDGGDGGKLTFVAEWEDIALFALVDTVETRAGAAGRGGNGGTGGSAGAGGPGGSGASWSESHIEIDRHLETEEVDHGDGRVSTKSYWVEDERTVTEHFSTDDGSTGTSGSSGGSGSNGQAGTDGRDGEHWFVINYPDGTQKRFKSIFNLALNPYQVQDASGDSIFEPSEVADVIGLSVNNTGEMPTPPLGKSEIGLSLLGDAWHTPVGQNLFIPLSIQPNHSYAFKNGLQFKVADNGGLSTNGALRGSFTVAPQATLHPVERSFSDFGRNTTLSVQYPIKIEVSGPTALLQGQSGRIRTKITNISSKALGDESTQKRLVELMVKDAPNTLKSMEFQDSHGKWHKLTEGLVEAIHKLDAGQTLTLDGRIIANDKWRELESYTFDSYLRLGKLENPEQVKPIQLEQHRVSVAGRYDFGGEADVTIVINQQTRPEELDAWRKLVEQDLGLKLASWNESYYANLDLDSERIADSRGNLIKRSPGHAFILLDNRFKSVGGRWVNTLDYLTKNAFNKAVNQNDINFLVVGNKNKTTSANILRHLSTRTEPGANSRQYKSDDELYEGIKTAQRDTLAKNSRPQIGDDFHQWKMTGNYWNPPTKEDFVQKAKQVEERLRILWPNRRYLVSHDYRNEVLAEQFGRDKYHVGDITVQRITDATDDSVVFSNVDDNKMHTQDYVLGDQNIRAVMKVLSTENKLKAIDKVLPLLNQNKVSGSQKRAIGWMMDSLVEDVLEEQGKSPKTGSPREASPTLAKISSHKFRTQIEPNTQAESLWLDFESKVRAANYYDTSATSQANVELLNRAQAHLIDDENIEGFLEKTAAEQETVLKGAGDLPWHWRNKTKNEIVTQHLTGHTRHTNVMSSTEVFDTAESRIIDRDFVRELESADEQRQRKWEVQFDENQKILEESRDWATPEPSSDQ